MKNRSLATPGSGASPLLIPSSETLLPQDPHRTAPVRRLPLRQPAAHLLCGLLVAAFTLSLTACHSAQYYYYKFPVYTYAGRPVPPSQLAERVMIGYTFNGSSGALAIVDGLRDIRSNIEDTIPSFAIRSYSSGYPGTIFNFPAEVRGYVYSNSDGSLVNIDYSTEASSGSVGTFQSGTSAVAIPSTFTRFYGAEEAAGVLEVIDNINGGTYALNIPNVYRVVVNTGDTVALAMVRNANVLYRVFKLNQLQFANSQLPACLNGAANTSTCAIAATGAVDCEPFLNPVYCAVAVPGAYDQPTGVYFSLDGATAYVLNCGPECGGNTASVTLLQQGPLNNNVIPSSPIQPNPQIANVPVPGGVTEALSDGVTLYLAGQQLQPDGLFAGFLSTMNQATNTITGKVSISDGTHTKMLFADNNTLWIGSQFCATGERAKLNQNYNCLTMVTLGATSGTVASAQIVPNVTPGGATVVPFPNQNDNQYYYGSLTGICWVQNFNKVYTAYGGQVHIFSTIDGSEIDNTLVAVQGTALDVAYMDAISDGAD